MTEHIDDDNFHDHPDDILGDLDPLTEEEGDLFVLFADALDPNTPKSIEESKSEWEELFG